VGYVKNPPDIDSAVDELVNWMGFLKNQEKSTTQSSRKQVRFENSDADEEKAKTNSKTPCKDPSSEKVVRKDNSFINAALDSALVSVLKELKALRKELHYLRLSRLWFREDHQQNPKQNSSVNQNQSQNQFRHPNQRYRGQNFIHGFRRNQGPRSNNANVQTRANQSQQNKQPNSAPGNCGTPSNSGNTQQMVPQNYNSQQDILTPVQCGQPMSNTTYTQPGSSGNFWGHPSTNRGGLSSHNSSRGWST